MNTRNTSDDQEKFKEAGEQAARVLGEFVSMANEFSRRFEKDFDSRADSRSQQTQDRSSTQDNDGYKATDYLNELGDAASSAIGGFANGFRALETGNDDRREWGGQRSAEWLDQAAELLKQKSPAEFFDKLKGYGEHASAERQGESVHSARQEKLHKIFSDRAELEALTEDQFEELHEFMQANYKAALHLVRKR